MPRDRVLEPEETRKQYRVSETETASCKARKRITSNVYDPTEEPLSSRPSYKVFQADAAKGTLIWLHEATSDL